ncbi:MAG TPA: RDD family protein [Terriglobia bacterium]|nr:RDD family protein [Terriglobia bacterium]
MERKARRTLINISAGQPQLAFEEPARLPEFTTPEYQMAILPARISAGAIDFGVTAVVYGVFIAVTQFQMPAGLVLDRRLVGVYGAGFLILLGVYFMLFMISSGQTVGMKVRGLTAVTRDGDPMAPGQAIVRGAGYFISIFPVMVGFLWALIDPERLTWADKVSGTYVKKV